MITVSTVWKNSAQLSKKVVALVRLHYGDETNYITIASGSIQGFDEEYRPMLLSSPVSTSGVDMFTHKFQASKISLKVSNGDYHPGVKFSDLVNTIGSGNDIGFENRQCEIRLWTKGITTWNDCVQFFNGVVREITQSPTEIAFSIQDKREIIHRPIGVLLTDADAADTNQGLPEGSRGKTSPIIYGDHTFLKGDDSKTSDTTSSINNIAPCVYLGIDSSGKHRWLISNHQVDEILISGLLAQLWALDSTLARFVRLYNSGADLTVEQNNSSGCIISHTATPEYIDYLYGKGTPAASNTDPPSITDFANPERSIDGDFTTASTGSLNTGSDSIIPSTANLIIQFPDWEDQNIADANINFIAQFLYAKLTFSGAADDTYVSLKLLGNPPSITLIDPSGASYPDLRLEDVTATATGKAAITSQVQIALTATKNFGVGDQAVLDIYQYYKAVIYNRGILPLYFAGRGREYNESTGWITSRTGTEPHADNNGGGNLIENPAGAIESIYRDELGRVDADINEDSFNVASNDISAMEFSFALLGFIKSLDLVGEMAREARSFVWLQPDSTIKMKTLEDEFTASDVSLDFKTLINPTISRTKLERIFTAVNVDFADDGTGTKNQSTGVAEDTVYQTKYNLSEAESSLTFESKHIGDSATAILLRSYLLAQWKQPHNQLDFGVGVEHIELDIGDIIEFSNVPFKILGEDITDNTVTRPSGQQVINKFWWIYNVKRSLQGSTIKAFQLHKLD